MKVILLKDIPKVGKKYDVKDFSDGYARNFLIARNLAEPATPQALLRIETLQKRALDERRVQEELITGNIKSLEKVILVMKEKANEQGHLFAGVHTPEIVKAIKESHHIDLDPSFIDLVEPLKTIGDHTIKVEGHGKKGKFILRIEKE